MDFTIIKRAGLRNTDFAYIVGSSDMAVSHWVNKRSEPRPSNDNYLRIKTTMNYLEQWVANGKLPRDFKKTSERYAAREKIKTYIDQVLAF